VKKLLLLAALTTGCAPTYRIVTKKCPPTAAVMGDVLVGALALAASTIHWEIGNEGKTVALAAIGGGMLLGANLSEDKCRR
jgi:hypothetical protein